MTASSGFPRRSFSSSERLYSCFAISLIVLGSENWSHQFDMSRNACRRLRSEREFCEREAARCSSRAMPEPPSRKLMTVSNCSIPSSRGSDAAPTREGSSPSSFAKVYHEVSFVKNLAFIMHNLHAIHSSCQRSGPQEPARNSRTQDLRYRIPRQYLGLGLDTRGR